MNLALSVFQATVGVTSFFLNTLVLLVTIKYKPLHNSQSSYRVSLALADLLYALMIIPESLISLLDLNDILFLEQVIPYNENKQFSFAERNSSSHYYKIFPPVIFVALLVSLYTLLAASVDRLLAVFRPFTYRTMNMRRTSKIVCVAVWMLCITAACLPVFNLGFMVIFRIHSIQILNYEHNFGAIYGLLIGTPFVLMLLSSNATYFYVRKHTQKTKRLHSERKEKKSGNTQARLARTLAQMVAGFSLMTLPTIITIMVVTMLPNINPANPRSFNLHAYSVIDFVGVAGYLCLTCSTILNFVIYYTTSKIFRKCFVELFVDVSKKLGCLTGKISRLKTATKTNFISKTVEESTTIKKEKIEIGSLKNAKNSTFHPVSQELDTIGNQNEVTSV